MSESKPSQIFKELLGKTSQDTLESFTMFIFGAVNIFISFIGGAFVGIIFIYTFTKLDPGRNPLEMLLLLAIFGYFGVATLIKMLQCFKKQNEGKKANQAAYSNSPMASGMYHLFKEGLLTDFELRVGSETVRVHKNILAARSPVFLARMTNEMEKSSDSLVCNMDLDMDTVRHLIQFLYLDTISDLNWCSIMKLYSAADKYNIAFLKSRCSRILKSKLHAQNVCSILSLSDTYTDDDLKSYVQEFIFENEAEILSSQKWENFIKTDINLASQVMVYISKRRKERAIPIHLRPWYKNAKRFGEPF